jgi:predicted nicotinamide N-methyase
MKTDPETFIRDNTDIIAPPHVPEIRLHLASEAHDLWLKTEEELEEIGLPPPFWAFAWAGGQGLARHVLDHPDLVAGKHVIDFASGSGLVAIAAMKAGAASVLAVDIDPWTETAIRLNAGLNGVDVSSAGLDMIGTGRDADVYLAGDVFYDKAFADPDRALAERAGKKRCRCSRRRSRPRLLPARPDADAGDLSGAGDPGAGGQRSQEDHGLAVSIGGAGACGAG